MSWATSRLDPSPNSSTQRLRSSRWAQASTTSGESRRWLSVRDWMFLRVTLSTTSRALSSGDSSASAWRPLSPRAASSATRARRSSLYPSKPTDRQTRTTLDGLVKVRCASSRTVSRAASSGLSMM